MMNGPRAEESSSDLGWGPCHTFVSGIQTGDLERLMDCTHVVSGAVLECRVSLWAVSPGARGRGRFRSNFQVDHVEHLATQRIGEDERGSERRAEDMTF